MSDLTDRLLHWSELEDMDSLCTEAADEIDCLRAEIETLQKLISELDAHKGAEGWSEGLREAIDAAMAREK